MTFTAFEIEFMNQADIGRLATIQPDGTPQNSPVGFTFNEQLGTIDISGYEMSRSRKFRNLCLLFNSDAPDDLLCVDPGAAPTI